MADATKFKSQLVAHRGDQSEHVENTLKAFRQGVDAGAEFAECDIQFTRDLIPVIIHDDHLKRLCDLALHVSRLDLVDLKELCYPYFKLTTLRKLLAWLQENPSLTLFIEIKPDIRTRLSGDEVAALLKKEISIEILPRIVLISESASTLQACQKLMKCSIGWVAEGEDRPDTELEKQLGYIFMPYSKAESIEAWHQRGVKVGLYTINEATLAREMLDLDADLIETDHFSRLLTELHTGHDSSD